MKLLSSMLRSVTRYSHQTRLHWSVRTIFTNNDSSGGNIDKGNNSSESPDDFERRIFSGFLDNNSNTSSFFQKLDRYEKGRGKSGFGSQMNDSDISQFGDGIDKSFDTLSDGMDNKLKKSASTFIFSDEIQNDDYVYRPDVTFKPGMTYSVKDLDLTKPGIQKSFKRPEFQVTTEEVLKKADFRNVRFLANFLTEAGIIIKRSKTRISAKAQRKVAREIKTARSFGLMPFTTMGTKPFVFGKTMQDRDEDYEYDDFDRRMPSAAFEAKNLI